MTAVSKIVGLIFPLFLLLSIQPAHAEERSFEISEVDIQAHIDNEGNMHVTEIDTYHFDGVFNGIIVELNTTGSDGIEQFQAVEVSGQQHIPLHFEESVDGSTHQYKVHAPSEDETKVFQFTYSLKNVVQVYADTAELYWKFFDQTNPSELGTARIHVELPDGIEREEITAFGHGPLHGGVEIEDSGNILYQVSPLPSEELLEVRILFPHSFVADSTKISTAPMLEQIMEEEQNWATEEEDASAYAALALLFANLVAGIIIYVKFGKRLRPNWKGKYYRELPSDVTPAIVSYLMNYRIKPQDLMATMIDLVRKKHATMHTVKEGQGKYTQIDYRFKLIDKKMDGLLPHEIMLIDWFFKQLGKDGVVSLSDIRRRAANLTQAEAFLKNWSAWKDEVLQSVKRLNYVESQLKMTFVVIGIVIVQFFGFCFLAPEGWNWLMFLALPLLFFTPKWRRRTSTGQTEYTKWRAFKRFLRDYSQIEAREPLAVHLWEHYFVYAIPLREAKRMIAMTQLKMPNVDHNQTHFDRSLFDDYDYLTKSFEQTVSTANKTADSDSNSSFSSGGGGGGGGGGRGAF